jgi:hypothetical protein
MENSFTALLGTAKSVVLMVPSKPFFDEVASSLSLYLALKNSGKAVSVVCPSPMTVEYNRLVGIDKVATSLGGVVGNLVIQFDGYDATKIDRVSYDVDGSTFKLTVIPKAGNQSPTQSQVKLVGGDNQTFDLLVFIGGDDMDHFPLINLQTPPTAKLVHIGIKMLGKLGTLPVVSFAKPASSVSEVVTGYIKEMNLAIDKDMATNLLGGIEAHTQSFIAGTVTPVTFEMAAELIKLGGVRGGAFVPPAQPPVQPGQPNPMPQSTIQPTTNSVPFNYQPMSAPAPIDVPVTPTPVVAPMSQTVQSDPVNPPADWLNPKIYTGTNVS